MRKTVTDLYKHMSVVQLLELAIGNSKRIGTILAQNEDQQYHNYINERIIKITQRQADRGE